MVVKPQASREIARVMQTLVRQQGIIAFMYMPLDIIGCLEIVPMDEAYLFPHGGVFGT